MCFCRKAVSQACHLTNETKNVVSGPPRTDDWASCSSCGMRERQAPPAAGRSSHAATKSNRSASMMIHALFLKCGEAQPCSLLSLTASSLTPSRAEGGLPPVGDDALLWQWFVDRWLQVSSNASKASLQELRVVTSTRVNRKPLAKRPNARTWRTAKPASKASGGVRLSDPSASICICRATGYRVAPQAMRQRYTPIYIRVDLP